MFRTFRKQMATVVYAGKARLDNHSLFNLVHNEVEQRHTGAAATTMRRIHRYTIGDTIFLQRLVNERMRNADEQCIVAVDFCYESFMRKCPALHYVGRLLLDNRVYLIIHNVNVLPTCIQLSSLTHLFSPSTLTAIPHEFSEHEVERPTTGPYQSAPRAGHPPHNRSQSNDDGTLRNDELAKYICALGIEPRASPPVTFAEVRAAFRRRILETHPDKRGDETRIAEFVMVREAYEMMVRHLHATCAAAAASTRR